MNKILLGIGALVLGLAFVGEASAAPGRGAPVRRAYSRSYFGATPYHLRNGVKFSGGYYFNRGRHTHWSHRVWSPNYNRFHYYDPYLRVYYYYSPIQLRYLPVAPVGVIGGGVVIR